MPRPYQRPGIGFFYPLVQCVFDVGTRDNIQVRVGGGDLIVFRALIEQHVTQIRFGLCKNRLKGLIYAERINRAYQLRGIVHDVAA